MHPPSFFSFVTSRKFLPIFIVLVVFLAAVFYFLQLPRGTNKKEQKMVVVPTPNQLSGNATLTQHVVAPNNAYTFSYPNSWKNVSHTDSLYTTITYTQKGITYTFRVVPPGQLLPEGAQEVTSQTKEMTYGGRKYQRTIWASDGKPFYVTAIPEVTTGADVAHIYAMAMSFTKVHGDDYITIFDTIAATLRY